VIPFIWAHLYARKARSVALLLGVLVATTGFTVLTGATDTARLEVTGAVNRSADAAYQVLVRPKGMRTALEDERQKVRPNSLSGIYGGITPEQARQIAALDGVDVAAPIAMVGYANAGSVARVDITNLVDRSLDRQLIRMDKTFFADRGLSSAKGRSDFVYVTKHEVAWPKLGNGASSTGIEFSDGSVHPGAELCNEGLAVIEEGRSVCQWIDREEMSNLMKDTQSATLSVFQLTADGRFRHGFAGPDGNRVETGEQAVASVSWHVPMLLAAVDPAAEARLVGLDGAVTAGHYLGPADRIGKQPAPMKDPILPVISVEQPYPDNNVRIGLSRIGLSAPPPGDTPANALATLDAARGPQLETRTLTSIPEATTSRTRTARSPRCRWRATPRPGGARTCTASTCRGRSTTRRSAPARRASRSASPTSSGSTTRARCRRSTR
jgi:putative ABC transport system permease protein